MTRRGLLLAAGALGLAACTQPVPSDDYKLTLINVYGGSETEREIVPASFPCGMNEQAAAFAQLWINHPKQQRQNMRCVPELVAAARYRCERMMAANHFDHVMSDGETPNQVVRRFYGLPDYYNDDNQVESLGHGFASALRLMRAIETTDTAHKDHIFGTHPGWRGQTCIGVWCEQNPGGEKYGPTQHETTWCLLSAEPMEGELT